MPHWSRIYIQRSSSKITGSDTTNLRFWATEFMGIQLTGNKSVILALQWTGGSCMLKKMQAHCVLNILFSRLWASLVAQMIKILQYRRLRFDAWVRKIPWKREWLHTLVFLGFPGDSDGKDSACKAGGLGSIPASVIFSIHSRILA